MNFPTLIHRPIEGLRRERHRDLWAPWLLLLFAVLIFGVLQIGGGAYSAEFDGHPDEAAHFMTGLLIRDYLHEWPPPPPVVWAEQYYVHYPKVSFGHWPPLFHSMLALWWTLFSPSRFSAILLIGLLSLAVVAVFYRIARNLFPRPVALAGVCLLMASPVFQQSASQVMAEQLTLFFGLLFIGACAHLIDENSHDKGIEAGIWGALCLLVKGTAVCLIPVPLIALLLNGRLRSRQVRSAAVTAVVIMLVVTAVWYSLQNQYFSSVVGWGGLRRKWPWRIDLILSLAGPGFLALGIAGMLTLLRFRQPLVAVSAALGLSCAAASYFVRAMNEPRHFYLALPAILLLAFAALHSAWEFRPALPLLAAVGLLFFPWTYYRQHPAGYVKFTHQIALPSRILASGTPGWRIEGSSIVLISLREHRPSSIVIRATKFFRPLEHTSSAVLEIALDQYNVQTVILAPPSDGPETAQQILLRDTMAASPAWRPCIESGSLRAYCRVLPPQVPLRPIEVDVRKKLGRSFFEQMK